MGGWDDGKLICICMSCCMHNAAVFSRACMLLQACGLRHVLHVCCMLVQAPTICQMIVKSTLLNCKLGVSCLLVQLVAVEHVTGAPSA